MQALDGTQQLMGQLGTSNFMALPRKCHKQKKMVGVFSVVGLLFPTPPTFVCYFPLSKSRAPPSPCHVCSSSPLVVGFRTLVGRGELLQEQFWLMGTSVDPAARLVPSPISNAESCETPAVGDTAMGNFWTSPTLRQI